MKKFYNTLLFLILLVLPVQAFQLIAIIHGVTATTATFDFLIEIPNSMSKDEVVLEYGLDENYGTTVKLTIEKKDVNGLSEIGSITVKNLKPHTEYHYRVTIKDKASATDIHSLDDSFTTVSKNKTII